MRDGLALVAAARPFPVSAGQAKVEDFHQPIGREEYVLRLEIAMHDAFGVCRGEPLRNTDSDFDRPPPRHGEAQQSRPQSLPLEKLEDGVGCRPLPTNVVNSQDVRMRESGNGLGLTLESAERFMIAGEHLG